MEVRSKSNLIELLLELAYLEPNTWKSRAYRNTASILGQMADTEFQSRSKFKNIPGIGEGIEKKILEYKSTGGLSKLTELRMKYPKKLDQRLYKVRDSYVTKRIPLDEAKKLFDGLAQLLGVPSEDITLCGSARRQSELVGDLDIVISTTDKYLLNKIKSKLSSYKVTVSGNKKLSFIIQESTMTPVDIYITDPSTYIPMVLFLTGSGNFNIKMRGKAKQYGYKLNQYGLFDKDGNLIEVHSEKDIFKMLHMDYVEPKNR